MNAQSPAPVTTPLTDEELERCARVPGKSVKKVVDELRRVRAIVRACARKDGIAVVPLHDVLPLKKALVLP